MQVGVWRIRGIDYISQNAMSHFENTNQSPEREGERGTEALVGQRSGEVQPVGPLVRFAGVDVHNVLTVFALHVAAPLELALALGDALYACGVVPSATAHDFATIHAPRGLVAHPTGRA